MKNKTAVITGASSGLGRACVSAYVRAGADVVITDRRKDLLLECRESVDDTDVRIEVMRCDVRDEKNVQEVVDETYRLFGKIDILCNFAAVTDDRPIHEQETAQWEDVIRTDLTGAYFFCKHVIPIMQQQHYGKIINIGSANGIVASKLDARHAYNAAKSGLHGFTKGMAATYMKEGITVNAVAPGLFPTEMTEAAFANPMAMATYNRIVPAGRPGRIDELNGTLLYLSSDASSYVTGQIIAVDGGYTISQLI